MSQTEPKTAAPDPKSEYFTHALTLPQPEPAELASLLIQSLETADSPPEREPGLSLADDIERRIDDDEAGRPDAIPWRHAIDEVRQSLRPDRTP